MEHISKSSTVKQYFLTITSPILFECGLVMVEKCCFFVIRKQDVSPPFGCPVWGGGLAVSNKRPFWSKEVKKFVHVRLHKV